MGLQAVIFYETWSGWEEFAGVEAGSLTPLKAQQIVC